jgi:hypothetical protein
VGISGAFETFPRGAIFPRPGHVRVVFGEPIAPSKLEEFQGREGQAALVEHMTLRIAECLREADAWRAER